MRKVLLLICACLLLAPTQKAECPTDMVVARPGVCIDRYEYSAREDGRPSLAMSGITEEPGPIYDAWTLCALKGKRTCTRREWMDACRGPAGSNLPYGGTKPQPGKCNTDKQWRDVNQSKVARRDARELDRLDQSEPSGSFSECVSLSGAYDMVGNAEEWVRCDAGVDGWCLVGGYWADARSSCSYVITKHAADWHYYETGFRCCKDTLR